MTDRKWQLEALSIRAANMGAIAQAHVDAGNYGAGWIRVDANGYQERVDPKEVTIIYGKPEDGWIKCSERMPEDSQWCAVNTEYGYYVQCWGSEQGWLGDEISIPNCDVTHWMPLPDAPKPEK